MNGLIYVSRFLLDVDGLLGGKMVVEVVLWFSVDVGYLLDEVCYEEFLKNECIKFG